MKVDLVDLGVVKIRRGRYSDARAIQALFSQAPYVGNGDSSGYQLEDVRAYIRRDLVLVAVSAEKRIVGALWDILYPRHLIGGACAVRADYEHCGVYRGMAEARVRFSKQHGIKYLETSTVLGNRRMQTLFRRHGYSRVATLETYSKEL